MYLPTNISLWRGNFVLIPFHIMREENSKKNNANTYITHVFHQIDFDFLHYNKS